MEHLHVILRELATEESFYCKLSEKILSMAKDNKQEYQMANRR